MPIQHALRFTFAEIQYARRFTQYTPYTKQHGVLALISCHDERRVEGLIEQFKSPIMVRSDQTILDIDELQEMHGNKVSDRTDGFSDVAEQIHTIVAASNKCVKLNKGAAPWRDYIDYLNRFHHGDS